MGRVAVVTGGSRGIGAAISKALKAAGYKVAANYAGNDEAAAKFKAETGIPVYKWDVSNYEACVAGLKQVEADLGPVEVLVNNAGITRDGLLMRMSDADFDDVIRVNLRSAFVACRAAARPMMRGRFGRIINMASIAGIMGNPGQANYAASKAGLIGMTKSIAKEIGSKGITANVVAPGFIQTDMTEVLPQALKDAVMPNIPLRSFGQASDIAAAVAYLASDDAGYVTGHVLQVDGGLAM